jgi:hypothetical protein
VTLDRAQRGTELSQSAVSNWSLPADTEYSLVNVTRGRAVHPTATLSADLVADAEEIEIQPVLVAGACDGRRR